MRTDNEISEGVEDAKHCDVNRGICGGIDGKSEGMEIIAFEWDHKIFSGAPFVTFVELVFRGEPGRVPNPANAGRKCDARGRGDIHVTCPGLFLMSSVRGRNESTGLEGLGLMGKQQIGHTSTLDRQSTKLERTR